MGMKARTLTEYRREMARSIAGFYRRRGYGGGKLYQFVQDLQTIPVERLLACDASYDQIKKLLIDHQSSLLKVQAELCSGPAATAGSCRLISLNDPLRADVNKAHAALFRRRTVGFECHYAGLGSRLEMGKAKFTATSQDLLRALATFVQRLNNPGFSERTTYKVLFDQIAAAGGLSAVRARFSNLRTWTIGERIFLAKLFDLRQNMAGAGGFTPEDYQQLLHSLKYKIVIGSRSGDSIVASFLRRRFFGLDPRNVIFMRQSAHPSFAVNPDGSLEPDHGHLTIGNHGLIPFQSNLDNQWFRFVPGNRKDSYQEERLTASDYRNFQRGLTTLLIENVEDTTQYLRPLDYAYLAKVEELRQNQGLQMAMRLVGQKNYNPQRGGFLAWWNDPRGRRRPAVIESGRLPFLTNFHDTRYLNENRNAICDPNSVDAEILRGPMIDDLAPTLRPRGRKRLLRIEPKIPHGDRNLYLDRVAYITDERPQPIRNLKDPADIIPTLEMMELMEADPELVKFARSFCSIE